MPNRVLRDGLRSSEAINRLSDAGHRLYTHLLITADDFGLIEWTPGYVKAHAVPAVSWTLERTAELMQELVVAQLVRLYEGKGKSHAAIEKWEQRRNAKHPKFPMPPWGMEHILGGYVAPRARADQAPDGATIAKPARRSPARWWETEEGIKAKGAELGLSARPGETWPQFKGRVNEAIDASRQRVTTP